MLATIRNLGDCPCPRCLTPMTLADKFGTPEDMQLRVSGARIDSEIRRKNISKARKLIHGKLGAAKNTNYGVNSAAVERLLKKESLVPTSVSSFCSWLMALSHDWLGYRMPFQTA